MILTFSVIGIAMIIICTLDIIFAAPAMNVAPWFFVVAVIVSVIYQFAIDGLFAWIVGKCPNKWFENKKFFNVSKKEQRFYEKIGIRSWKDKVWELGGLGGFSKAKIADPKDPEYSKRFLIESYKGEIDHIIGMFVGFTVIFIFPLKFAWIVGVPVAIVNLVLNYMPVMILRYNTPKLEILYKRAVRNQQRQEELKVQENTKNEQIQSGEELKGQSEFVQNAETKEDAES